MLDRDDIQLIERHLDGELTPAEEGRLKSLLAGSGEARTLVAALKSLDEGDREAANPPADAVPQIMARVRELPRPQQAGLLSSAWTTPPNGRRRRVYSLTKAGLSALGERRKAWGRFSQAVETALGGGRAWPA